MAVDFFLDGQAHGSVANRLMASGFDLGVMRPFIGNDGNSYVTVNGPKGPEVKRVANATATLRKDEWIQIDKAIIKAAKPRLKAIADLRGAGLEYVIPNGMGKTMLESETMSDINEATVSMDGVREGVNDRPIFKLNHLPLPIIHKDYGISLRQLQVSRNGNSPFDTTMAELAARRVAEMAEQMILGLGEVPSFDYGGGTIQGYTNFADRNTATDFTDPTSSGWTPAVLIAEILQMRLQLQNDFHYGPWILYVNKSWDVYLDDDYSVDKGDNTLRDRIKRIEGITDVRTLDYLSTDYDLILVQMTPDVVRLVIGMEMTTIQWEEQGGMKQLFKIMTIMVPQLRADFNGNTGILHARLA